MTNGSLKLLLALGFTVLFSACKKSKEPPAVVEEVPSAAAEQTDTTATLAEEPDLKKVGDESKPGKNALSQPAAAAEQAGFSERGHFVVQVSVFKSKRQAARLVERLANEGYPAYVAEVENPTPELAGTYHRVRIGRFLRIADARSFGEGTLKPMGYEFWVDNKKNDQVGGGGSYSQEPSYTPSSSSSFSTPSEPMAPSEPAVPATPSGDSWGTPKPDAVPPVPSGDSWGTPNADAPSEPAASPASDSPTPATTDSSGKINLDEW